MYDNDDIILADNFLKFEHTDGLNYANIELRHTDQLWRLNKIKFSLKEGVGVGILLPRTNTTLLGMERYDEFHLSGYGISAMVGLKVSFFHNFYIQTEMKVGFINLPNVRTTISPSDMASQHCFFMQYNIVFGGTLGLIKY